MNDVVFELCHKWTVNMFSRISLKSMINLRTLILAHINYNELRNLFESKDSFSICQQLNILKIQSTNINGLDRERIFILKKIFVHMPKLRLCQIPLIDVNDFDDLIPTLTLEQLIIDYCTIICLDRLLNYVPSVRSLTVRIYTDLQNYSKYSSIRNPSNIHSSLRSLQISTVNNIPFNQIENFFKNSFKCLETLKFYFKTDASSQSCLDYIDDKRWESLLQGFILLDNFHCCIELPIQSTIESHRFEQNPYFLNRNWLFTTQVYTYSFNTILRLHTKPYLKRRLDIIPSKAFTGNNYIYSHVRDLRILIDTLPVNILHNSPGYIYGNVTSLTFISNKSFNEQTFLNYLYAIIEQMNLLYLTIQLDNCSKNFLGNLIEKCSKLYSLTLSTYHSWSKLIQLSTQISKSTIRSLSIYDVFVDFNQYDYIRQLFNQLEIISVTVTSVEDCYRLLTLLFIGNQTKTVNRLRSLIIKCDFDEPDTIANWVRSNILKKLTYKCTTSVLSIWL